jgi:DNA-binding LacI/PurR family transcriptional regulator
VGIDEEKTAYETIEKLRQRGYQKMAFYFPRKVGINKLFPDDYIFSREKYLREAMKSFKLKLYPDSNEQRKRSNNPAKYLLKELTTPPDCIITYGIYHAMELNCHMAEMGAKAPRDLGILSYSYSYYNFVCQPKICGIDYNMKEIGANLADMMLKRLKTGKNYRNMLTKGSMEIDKGGHHYDSLDTYKTER